ncbi:MAG TPA: L,D-transpeptidase family protein [Usitatibacter sp.]|nr:L,D-transpeptidase family protein [Usitatibacter sp.]
MTQGSFIRSGLRITRVAALVSFAMAAGAIADGSGGGAISIPPTVFSNEAEGALVRALTGLREQGMKTAMAEVDRMLERNPNHKLAHMIQGDLLMARAGKPVAFAVRGASVESVSPLKDEARVRMKRYLDAPPVNYLPAPLLQLSAKQSHVLLIDTTRSRLFVYANDLGRPRYVTDFYISLGKNGVEKTREGDQKTPLGVYTIVSVKDKLPDFYGREAFPISYPNEWDRANGRAGHGIWLHGTPSDTYARPPRATDGCVVLTNEDLARLSKYVDVSRTPVVIGEAIEWRSPEAWERDREGFLKAFARWKSDWESLDTTRYLANYSAHFRSKDRDLDSWGASKRKVNSGKKWVKIGVNDMSLFAYPGTPGLMMITFEQDYRSNNMSRRTVKRQYWSREGSHWRIVHETVVNS